MNRFVNFALGVAAALAMASVAGFWLVEPLRDDALDAPATVEPALKAPPPMSEATGIVVSEPTSGNVLNEVSALDVLRVERDGAALIAGSAAPGAEISVKVDGDIVAEAAVGGDGAFVAFFDVPQGGDPGGLRRVDLVSRDETGGETALAAPVFIAPPKADEPDAQPLAVQPTETGADILQASALGGGAPVALDVVSYGEEGAVTLQGRAAPARLIRIYANAKLIAETLVEPNGEWRAEAGAALRPGAYRLRVDEIDESGAVSSRIDTPFRREAASSAAPDPGEVVVEPGDTLWTIAERLYDEGVRFTVIYEANRDRIRDPDLIFPGQIFSAPAAAAN